MKNKPEKKKSIALRKDRECEMLTIFCYIGLDSPESAAKRVVLMRNMSDAFSRAVLRVRLGCI